MAIGQDITGDTELYHWYDSWAFLHGRLLTDVFPARFQTLLNPLPDVPFYLLDTHLPPTFAAFVLGSWQGTCPLLIYVIARRITSSRVLATFAGAAAGISGGFISELGSMMGDSTVAPFLLLGVLFVVVAADSERSGRPFGHTRWLWFASGASIGVGVGLKYAVAAVGAALIVAVCFRSGRWQARLRSFLWSGSGAVIGLGTTAGYWSWFLWRNFHDPFAFTSAPLGPFTSPIFPGGATPAAWRPPANLLQALSYPIYWFFHGTEVVGIAIRAASLPIAYVVVVGLLLVLLLRALNVVIRLPFQGIRAIGAARDAGRRATDDPIDAGLDRYFVAAFVASLVIWVKVFAVYRYLIPLELLSPLVIIAGMRRIAVALRHLPGRPALSRRAFQTIFIALCIICMGTESPGNYWARIPFGSAEYAVKTPAMLRNDRLNVIVEEGANASSFVLPELHSRFIAIGGIGDMLTPATDRRLHEAFAKARRSGGNVVGMWVSSDPGGDQAQFVGRLGDPGLVQSKCVQESVSVGFGYEPIGFCKYVPRQHGTDTVALRALNGRSREGSLRGRARTARAS